MARVALVTVNVARDTASTSSPTERVAHALALELRGELGEIDRKIAVRLVVIGHYDAVNAPIHIEAHQDFDRAFVSARKSCPSWAVNRASPVCAWLTAAYAPASSAAVTTRIAESSTYLD